MTKAGTHKDHHRCTSEKSLHNALNYAVAALYTHFAVGEELEENDHDALSNDAKSTIELVKKWNDNDKVRHLHPDEIFGGEHSSLLM